MSLKLSRGELMLSKYSSLFIGTVHLRHNHPFHDSSVLFHAEQIRSSMASLLRASLFPAPTPTYDESLPGFFYGKAMRDVTLVTLTIKLLLLLLLLYVASDSYTLNTRLCPSTAVTPHERIPCYSSRVNDAAAGRQRSHVALLSHGNAMDIGEIPAYADALAEMLDAEVVAWECTLH
jgi:hypothetical protein